MGWTCTNIPSFYASKRDYIDKSLMTWDNEKSTARVLKSAMVGAVYYGAIERVDKASGEQIVFAAVVLTKSDPRASDGLTFCYKEMDETVGPAYHDCPAGILDLLTETKYEYAIKWRQTCRDRRKTSNATRKKAPKIGDRFRLAEPVKFADGATLRDFLMTSIPRRGRSKTVFQSLENGRFYLIPKIGERVFEPLPAPEASETVNLFARAS